MALTLVSVGEISVLLALTLTAVDTDGDEVSWVEEAPEALNFGRTWMLKISGVQIMEVLPRPGLGKRKE